MGLNAHYLRKMLQAQRNMMRLLMRRGRCSRRKYWAEAVREMDHSMPLEMTK